MANSGLLSRVMIDPMVSDPSSARSEAAAKAVEDARTKAEGVARAAGVGLGGIVSVRYGGEGPHGPRPPCHAPPGERPGPGGCPPPRPDPRRVVERVTVEWEII